MCNQKYQVNNSIPLSTSVADSALYIKYKSYVVGTSPWLSFITLALKVVGHFSKNFIAVVSSIRSLKSCSIYNASYKQRVMTDTALTQQWCCYTGNCHEISKLRSCTSSVFQNSNSCLHILIWSRVITGEGLSTMSWPTNLIQNTMLLLPAQVTTDHYCYDLHWKAEIPFGDLLTEASLSSTVFLCMVFNRHENHTRKPEPLSGS